MTIRARILVVRRYWWIALVPVLVLLAACTSASPATEPATESAGSTATPIPATPTPTSPATPPSPTGEPAAPTPESAPTEEPPELPDDPTELMRATLNGNVAEIARKMVGSGNLSYIPVLLEFMRFQIADEARINMASFVNRLLEGPDTIIIPPERTSWNWWIEWLGNHPEIHPPDGFAGWKGDLYSIIDPGLGSFLYDGVKTRIRLEEVVWGGVAKDGIPDLIRPPVIQREDATYLDPSDRVFGVSINGEHRAYPLRILNLHEMANDVVGGVPFALAY